MVTKRTLFVPLALTGIAFLAGCGPPPRDPEYQTISMFAESVVDFSTNGSPPNSSDFSEIQALGEPNVPGCGDHPSAWSPAIANYDAAGLFTIDDFIVLEFPFYAFVREVRIYESYNPGAVVAVDLERSDDALGPLEIFEDPYGDGTGSACPSSFNIQVESNGGMTPDQFNRVAIYLDTSRIGDGNGNTSFDDDWPEIDAVEVIGDILVDD
jgi:hypothetical protein